jgi:hypothetical protein
VSTISERGGSKEGTFQIPQVQRSVRYENWRTFERHLYTYYVIYAESITLTRQSTEFNRVNRASRGVTELYALSTGHANGGSFFGAPSISSLFTPIHDRKWQLYASKDAPHRLANSCTIIWLHRGFHMQSSALSTESTSLEGQSFVESWYEDVWVSGMRFGQGWAGRIADRNV